MPAQRTDVYKRRYAKGRPAEVQWHPFFVVASFGRLTCRTHLPVRPYIAYPYIAYPYIAYLYIAYLYIAYPCIACPYIACPLHCRPARIAVSACVFLIGVAGQDNHAVASEDKKNKTKTERNKGYSKNIILSLSGPHTGMRRTDCNYSRTYESHCLSVFVVRKLVVDAVFQFLFSVGSNS